MPKIAKVTIGKDGSARIEFEGFEGATCLKAGADLNNLLAQMGITLEQTGFEAKPELLAAEQAGEIIPQRQAIRE